MNALFTFHSDPGHSWVQVDALDLKQAGLTPADFSRYSYRDGNAFYLEEDCDASKFVAAYQEKTGKHIDFEDRYAAKTFIRGLPRIHD